MTRTIAIGLILCGGALVWILRSAPNQSAPNVESTRLIESIQGPALYGAYCAVCHGKYGKGDGPMAMSLKSKTADLTRIASRNKGEFPLARVQRIISGEERIEAGHGTREMPVWGPVFSQIAWDQDLGRIRVHNLAKYLETLQVR
jgi:mono/diheme cytochrome c family protein